MKIHPVIRLMPREIRASALKPGMRFVTDKGRFSPPVTEVFRDKKANKVCISFQDGSCEFLPWDRRLRIYKKDYTGIMRVVVGATSPRQQRANTDSEREILVDRRSAWWVKNPKPWTYRSPYAVAEAREGFRDVLFHNSDARNIEYTSEVQSLKSGFHSF